MLDSVMKEYIPAQPKIGMVLQSKNTISLFGKSYHFWKNYQVCKYEFNIAWTPFCFELVETTDCEFL